MRLRNLARLLTPRKVLDVSWTILEGYRAPRERLQGQRRADPALLIQWTRHDGGRGRMRLRFEEIPPKDSRIFFLDASPSRD